MPDQPITVKLELKSQKVKEELEGVISSTGGFHIQNSNSALASDLLVLEVGDNFAKEFQNIHSVQASGLFKHVFLTSSRPDPDLLIQALRSGVKEFFSQPIKTEEVKNALLKLKDWKVNPNPTGQLKKRGKIIYVTGSKGGVGTTTIAVNLSTNLRELNISPSVALIDMNLIFGEIPIFLNLETSFNWGEVARNISRLDSTYLMSILSKHSSGVYVLPSPTGLDGVNVATPEIIEKLLGEMREVFDFVIVDGGQSFDDISLKIIKMSDILLLVAILSLPCLTNVKRLLWTLQKLGYPQRENIRIIGNRYHKKSLISLKEAEQSINQKIFWLVPNDYTTTMSAINQGKTLSSVAHGADISKSLRELASKL